MMELCKRERLVQGETIGNAHLHWEQVLSS
jgi:hypothetical protein